MDRKDISVGGRCEQKRTRAVHDGSPTGILIYENYFPLSKGYLFNVANFAEIFH
jgi:hypothetical protein